MTSGQEVDQCRLAGPVGSDDPQPLPAVERQVDPGQHRRARRVVEADAVAFDDSVAQPGSVPGQFQRCRPGRGVRAVVDEPVGGVDPGLGFAGSGLGPPSEPGQLPSGQVPTGGLGRGGLLVPLGPGLQI